MKPDDMSWADYLGWIEAEMLATPPLNNLEIRVKTVLEELAREARSPDESLQIYSAIEALTRLVHRRAKLEGREDGRTTGDQEEGGGRAATEEGE